MARWVAALVGVACLTTLVGCFSAPPQIVAISPDRGSTDVAADAPIRVQFDQPVDHASVAHRFTVSPGLMCDLGQAFLRPKDNVCYVTWLAGQPGFVLYHPGALFAPKTRYVFHLDGGVISSSGVANSLSHDWNFTSAPAPVVTSLAPASGGATVGIDGAVAITFSRSMNPKTTAAAISLTPSTPDTQIVPNTHDPTRYIVLPGRLLIPNFAYSLQITRQATGADSQPLATSVAVTFRTSGLSGQPHAAIVWGDASHAATTVSLASLSLAQSGDPGLMQTFLSAPTCGVATGCGDGIAFGSPVATYASVALSPGSAWLAVDQLDRTAPSAAPVLVVYDIRTQRLVASIPGATLPSWSGDGKLAYAVGSSVGVRGMTDQFSASFTLPAPLSARPQWTANDELVLATQPGGVPIIELADIATGAVIPAPGFEATSSPIASAHGSIVAQGSDGLRVLSLRTGGGPRTLAASVQPLGFTGTNTILGLGQSGLVQVSLADGSNSALAGGPQRADADSVAVVGDGRQIGWISTSGDADQVLIADSNGSGAATVTDFPSGATVTAASFAT